MVGEILRPLRLKLQEIIGIIMTFFNNRNFNQEYDGQIDLISNYNYLIKTVRMVTELYTTLLCLEVAFPKDVFKDQICHVQVSL